MTMMRKAAFVTGVAFMSGVSFAYDWSGKTGTVTLTESAEVSDADLAVVTNLTGIVLDGAETDLIFNNATIAATMKGSITGAGRIVKRGAADVFLGKPHTTPTSTKSGWDKYYQDNYTTGGIVVETGDLWFPQDGAANCCYGPTTVNSGATLHIHPDSRTGILSIHGSGLISNGKAWTCWDNPDHTVAFFVGYYGARDISDFSGSFEGNFAVYMCGNVRIQSPDTCRAAMAVSVFRNAFDSEEIGVLRIGKFGNRPPVSYRGYGPDDKDLSAFASPLGIGSSYYYGVDYDVNYGGHLIYTGTGETTDRIFRFGGNYNPEYCELDAGATGGVNFAGELRPYGTDRYYGLILTGSNTTPVTVSGKVGGNYGKMHYVKAGSGTWNWNPTTRTELAGAFFVVNGTFKFPTLADIGVDCSLGSATNCWKTIRYATLPTYWNNAANKLDCEIVLGDWVKNGTNFPTLAYTGATLSQSDRRIGLIGTGGTIASTSADGSLVLTGGVSPRTLAQVSSSTDATVRSKTLCLDAAGDGNAVGPIAENAAGTLGLVKKGAGTWSVTGDFALHGDIDVREGTLALAPKGLVPYTWFRYTVTQINKSGCSGNNQYLWQKQLGLFDKDGNRLSQNYTFVGPQATVYNTWHEYAGNYDWTALQPGQVTMGEYNMFHGKNKGITITKEPSNLFVDSTSYLRATLAYLCKATDPMFYFPIVFRLPEGSAPVKYFDIVQHYGCDAGDHVAAFKLEGSVDGVEWVQLHNQTECLHRSNTQWFSTGTTVTNGVNQNCLDGKFGYEIATGMEDQDALDLSTASAVKVAKGATLQVLPAGVVALPKLTVDCSGAGVATVKGFKIPANGVLDVENEPKGMRYELPVDFVSCSGLSNLAKWTVRVGGKIRSRRLSFVGDKAFVECLGSLIFVR